MNKLTGVCGRVRVTIIVGSREISVCVPQVPWPKTRFNIVSVGGSILQVFSIAVRILPIRKLCGRGVKGGEGRGKR